MGEMPGPAFVLVVGELEDYSSPSAACDRWEVGSGCQRHFEDRTADDKQMMKKDLTENACDRTVDVKCDEWLGGIANKEIKKAHMRTPDF